MSPNKSPVGGLRMQNVGAIALLSCLSLASVGCGKNSESGILKNVQGSTYILDEDAYVELSMVFNLGNATLPSLDLPVFDPRNPSLEYGRVRMRPMLDGQSEVALAVNVTEAARINAGSCRMANGTDLPIGGIPADACVAIEVTRDIRIYVALARGVAMVGFGAAIKEMDQAGSKVGTMNLFIPFEFQKVRGSAGTFLSKNKGQSGLAAFVDIGQLLSDLQDSSAVLGGAVASQSSALVALGSDGYGGGSSLQFDRVETKKHRTQALHRELYDIGRKKRKLTVH